MQCAHMLTCTALFSPLVALNVNDATFSDEESESDDDGDLADFDPDTMDELTRKRMERAREAEEHRKVLRKRSMEVKKVEQAALDKVLATIAKQKAAESKKETISDKDVKATQKRLDEEVDFGGFGFGD